MKDLSLTRRNMRYMGVIESLKYNNKFNEIKANTLKSTQFYEQELEPIIEDIEKEVDKQDKLKRKIYSLKNKTEHHSQNVGGV